MSTTSFYSAIEMGEKLDVSDKKSIFFDSYSEDMDGVFPRINEWTRFANKIDNEGLEWWGKRNLKYYDGIKSAKHIEYSKFEVEFSEPLEFVFFENEDESIQVSHSFKKIRFDLEYEWGFFRNGRQDKIANSVDINMENIEFLE